jgi:hypothetical protein
LVCINTNRASYYKDNDKKAMVQLERKNCVFHVFGEEKSPVNYVKFSEAMYNSFISMNLAAVRN